MPELPEVETSRCGIEPHILKGSKNLSKGLDSSLDPSPSITTVPVPMVISTLQTLDITFLIT